MNARTSGTEIVTHSLETPVGRSLEVHWRDGRIVGTRLVDPVDRASSSGPVEEWVRSWNAGSAPEFPADLLDWSSVPRRTREILAALSRVRSGETCTYGQIASWSGIPKGYQAVGQAMARNPFVLLVPCHRVLARDGGLGGYSAGGPAVKRRLLEHEGVRL